MIGSGALRSGSLAAIAGGLLWTLFPILSALKARGCVADECVGRPMRDNADIAWSLVGGGFLILLAFAAIVRWLISADKLGRPGKVGLILAIAGLASVTAGGVVAAASSQLVPVFILPGALLLALGLLVIGIQIRRSRLLARWVSWSLIIGVLAALGTNDQDMRVLMMIPFGAAWVTIGLTLIRQSPQPDTSRGPAG